MSEYEILDREVQTVLDGVVGSWDFYDRLVRYFDFGKETTNRNSWVTHFAESIAPRLWEAEEYEWLKGFYAEMLRLPLPSNPAFSLIDAFARFAKWDVDPKQFGLSPLPEWVEPPTRAYVEGNTFCGNSLESSSRWRSSERIGTCRG